MTIQVLLLMGGLGTRFSSAGYLLPKPLIDVEGVPMFRLAISSFDDLKTEKSFFAVVRAEHEQKYGLGKTLEEAGVHVDYLGQNTRGAAETAMSAMKSLDPVKPLVILDCDLKVKSSTLFDALSQEVLPFDGGLTYFYSRDSRYSYAKVDSNGIVSRTAEKEPISSNALIGCYAFNSASVFFGAASILLESDECRSGDEFYISSVYNVILEHGGNVLGYPGDFDSFGTPEELKSYLSRAG